MTMLWKWAFGMLLLLLTTQTHSLASTPPTTELQLGNACASLSGCTNCTNTYSCHWCEFDEECHARGSVHGCSWGSSCNSKPPKPKENTTCASQATCSECSLSSHLCHWCELDNACHAVGSRFGCSVGIDCYSNDRCRRSDPEHFHKWIVSEIPFASLLLLLLMGGILVGGLSCCHFCVFNVKGAYDDLATITMAASLPPSVIGGTLMMMGSTEPFYTTLETHPKDRKKRNLSTNNKPMKKSLRTRKPIHHHSLLVRRRVRQPKIMWWHQTTKLNHNNKNEKNAKPITTT